MEGETRSIQRHPVRGALWGIPLGVGITMVLVGQRVISLGTWAPILTVLAGIGLGVAWSWFAPPKGPKEAEGVAGAAGEPSSGG